MFLKMIPLTAIIAVLTQVVPVATEHDRKLLPRLFRRLGPARSVTGNGDPLLYR